MLEIRRRGQLPVHTREQICLPVLSHRNHGEGQKSRRKRGKKKGQCAEVITHARFLIPHLNVIGYLSESTIRL